MGVQEGGYFNGKAQERLLDRCVAVDARVALVESCLVTVTLALSRRVTAEEPARGVGVTAEAPAQRREPRQLPRSEGSSGSQKLQARREAR